MVSASRETEHHAGVSAGLRSLRVPANAVDLGEEQDQGVAHGSRPRVIHGGDVPDAGHRSVLALGHYFLGVRGILHVPRPFGGQCLRGPRALDGVVDGRNCPG